MPRCQREKMRRDPALLSGYGADLKREGTVRNLLQDGSPPAVMSACRAMRVLTGARRGGEDQGPDAAGGGASDTQDMSRRAERCGLVRGSAAMARWLADEVTVHESGRWRCRASRRRMRSCQAALPIPPRPGAGSARLGAMIG